MNTLDINELWGLGVILFALGLGGGMLMAHFVLPSGRRAKRLEKELNELNAKFSEYRGQVTEHFEGTAHLFQGLTKQYRGLFDHLSSGARTFCGDENARLDFYPRDLLTDMAPAREMAGTMAAEALTPPSPSSPSSPQQQQPSPPPAATPSTPPDSDPLSTPAQSQPDPANQGELSGEKAQPAPDAALDREAPVLTQKTPQRW